MSEVSLYPRTCSAASDGIDAEGVDACAVAAGFEWGNSDGQMVQGYLAHKKQRPPRTLQ